MVRPDSPFAPLRNRAFFWLWLGVTISGVGTWMQAVGAQWLFVDDPNAATIVALIQTATTLPMVLLSLPAGVLADIFDRRWLLFFVQCYTITVAATLALLGFQGAISAPLLLSFTFALGVGMALQVPTWQSLIPEVVRREEIGAAARLDMISVNVARAVGPAVAGALIATLGVPAVFAANACCVAVMAVILLVWRRPRESTGVSRERFLPALRAGGRFVRHEPIVRRILARLAMFVAPATAMWALLPIIAAQRLGVTAGGYGLLFGALGVGAVSGAMLIPKVKDLLSANGLLAVAAVSYAVALATTVLVPLYVVALLALVVCGLGWTVTASVLVAELQMFLPAWVRARAVAIYMMTFTASQAVASPIWGQVTQHFGVVPAICVAATLTALTAVVGIWLRMPEASAVDNSPAAFWSEVALAVDPDPFGGPVAVQVDYEVAPENQEAFVAAMEDMRRSRRRNGATDWVLYRVGEEAEHFTEIFTVASWEEHLRQHATRLTAQDAEIEANAFRWASRPPRGRHLLPPGSAMVSPDDPDAAR